MFKFPKVRKELCEFLGAADIYITPYLNKEQVVSGTLAYALGSGKTTVSTPYWYAEEMLSDGRGRIVPFQGPDALAGQVDEPFGLSVVEAMACRTPVIAVNRGSMPEIIAEGIAGFMVSKLNEMAGAVTKVKQIDRYRCRQWIEERFSAKRMVQDYIRVYERVVRRASREEHRPWGFYEILSDTPDHKVKRTTIYPGRRLSYQRHSRHSEHWCVIRGKAVATRNNESIELAFGNALDVPLVAWHRIQNPGPENMVFIEVQTGDYFVEDDIERSEDDFGRI